MIGTNVEKFLLLLLFKFQKHVATNFFNYFNKAVKRV